LAIFVGGVVRWMVDQALARSGNGPKSDAESEISSGSLYASGLIAAGGIMGLVGVCVKLYEAATDKVVPSFPESNPLHKDWVSVMAFAALAFSLYYFARKPLDSEKILEQVEKEEI
jgi:hypothetical protein